MKRSDFESRVVVGVMSDWMVGRGMTSHFAGVERDMWRRWNGSSMMRRTAVDKRPVGRGTW
jgi:hypothetical protein